LLAQTRQATRDRALSEAIAKHREDLAAACEQHDFYASQQSAELLELIKQNTELTKELTMCIEVCT
jgi:hypothetical protein